METLYSQKHGKKLIITFETREKDNKNKYYLEDHCRH